MSEVNVDELVNCVQGNNGDRFRRKVSIFFSTGNIAELVGRCNEHELKLAIDWCAKDKVYVIHRLIEGIESVESIQFLKNFKYYDKVDAEKRTLLHVAVINDRSIEILEFLVNVVGISVESADEYDYTPLHYYCQKEMYDSKALKVLMKSPHQLTRQSKDGLTPLEFACSNSDNLQKIREMDSVDMKELLRKIDNIAQGITEVERFTVIKCFSTDRIWLNLLQKNDKYMLLSYIKNDEDFIDRYYLTPSEIFSIIKKCPENGQGILSFIKNRFIKGVAEPKLFKILSELTGITILERQKIRTFYKSALFLALLTGRFQLISPLLRCCQFEIVSYAMLICLVCKNFLCKRQFPDQVMKDILELKDFCEEFSIAVINHTYNKDLSEDKTVIGNYINRKSDKLDNKSIVEIAYHAKCIKYLGLPTCQESLNQVWTQRTYKCPQIKFWLHSIFHVIFLMLFSYVVVNSLFAKITVLEIICYVYGVGYFVEEIRQIYMMTKDDFFRSYLVDATNMIDIFAIVFMLLGFLLRASLDNPVSTEVSELKFFIESTHSNLYVQRLILCISLISFYMRVLYFASLNETLGPKLTMISTMITKDLIPILFLFNIFVVSFGVTFQSLLFPNGFYVRRDIGPNVTFGRNSPISTVADIFRRATFTIFNFHYTIADIEMSQKSNVLDVNGLYVVYFLLLIFMLVVNVMLMNLLIAQFSNTVTQIIIESKQSWKSSRYGFIHEYSDRTIAPPPFNIPFIIVDLIRSLMKKRSKSSEKVTYVNADEEDAVHLVEKETPEEPSMCYYIYQAFALSGQRYRLVKDVKDLEYEKEIHFRTIQDKLNANKSDIKRTITDKCAVIESAIKSQSIRRRHMTISTTASFR